MERNTLQDTTVHCNMDTNHSLYHSQFRQTVSLINPSALNQQHRHHHHYHHNNNGRFTLHEKRSSKSSPVTPIQHSHSRRRAPPLHHHHHHRVSSDGCRRHTNGPPPQTQESAQVNNISDLQFPRHFACTAKPDTKSDENRVPMAESPSAVNVVHVRKKKKKSPQKSTCSLPPPCTLRLVPPQCDTHKTIIIFDWDDTLLPSHYLQMKGLRPPTSSRTANGHGPSPTPLCEVEKRHISLALHRLQRVIHNLLFTALQSVGMGNLVIITNAEQGWVEMSTSVYLPQIVHMLASCRVISARSTFEASYPGRPIEWKRRAIQWVLQEACDITINIDKISGCRRSEEEKNTYNNDENEKANKKDEQILQDVSNANLNVNAQARLQRARAHVRCAVIDTLQVVSIGDSMVERQAVFEVTKCIKVNATKIRKVRTKSIKLLPAPSIEQLIDELNTIHQCFASIMQHPSDLDYQIRVQNV